MELQRPTEIRVTTEMGTLLGDAEAELNDFQSLGDFSSETLAELRREFLPQRLSDTLNIEGVRVNPRVTRAVLEGQTLSEVDRYNEREVLNAIDANDFMETQARGGENVRPSHIRNLQHKICLDIISDAGRFRQGLVDITGASFSPPPPGEVPRLVQELCDLAEEAASLYSIVRACWLHASFGAIHPFADGNGRTGRLLQDWVLIQGGYLPVGIPASRRAEYYEALHDADEGRWMPLVAIVANSQLTALERARRIVEAPKRRMERIRSLVRASQQTLQKKDYNKYEIWRRRTDGIRDEFQRWASDLSSEIPELSTRIKVWDPISFEKWQRIRERGQTRATWLFTLNFSINRRPVYSWLFYARRHEFAYTLEFERMEPGLVGVFLTGDEEPDPEYDFGQFFDPYVSLREILYVGDRPCAYREAKSTDVKESLQSSLVSVELAEEARWVSEEDIAIADIVEAFLEECLVKLGLIE